MKQPRCLTRLLAAGVSLCLLCALPGCSGGLTGKAPGPTEEQLTAVREELVTKSHVKDLGGVNKMEFYENGLRTASAEMNEARDNKLIYYGETVKRVVNYTDGYILDIPLDWVPDYSLSPIRVRYTADGLQATITVEEMIETNMETQLKEQVNKWLLNEDYQQANRITELQPTEEKAYGDFKAQIIRLKMEDLPQGGKPYYTYVNLYSDARLQYVHFLFKSAEPVAQLEDILSSFKRISAKGLAVYSAEYNRTIPDNWSEDTRAYYDRLCGQKKKDWGIFNSNMSSTGYKIIIPAMEKKIDYHFPIVSQYIAMDQDFPIDFANRVAEDGRVLQLTYHLSTVYVSDGNFGVYSSFLDVFRGECDEQLRKFAGQVRDYSKPLIFRLNNEMNSTWTNWCAYVNMLDPDIFVETWARLYRIFEEEGVNNAIWMFDPQSGSFPPGKWSNWINYLPPIEMVHMIGLTAYCSGNSGFPSFKELYTQNIAQFKPFFQEDWPMGIPEFACGRGDGTLKQEQLDWITRMFEDADDLPQIKYGVWFSANDYSADGSTIVNHYALDVKDEELMGTLKKGLAVYNG